ncbi:MAG: competence/damage-inducible protein A [Alphaproteobacteria bacterium]|nr:competence/damage-inducible protein A [Alphaproteobacteria bacterium]
MNDPAASGKIYTACVLVIGNEILSGRTQDTNLAYIAQGLAQVGVVLKEARVIPDVCDAIAATVNELRARYDYVFTTGGIGPTHDDITAESVAKAFGVRNILNPEALAIFQAVFKPEDLNEARLRMCHTPEGAELIPNPVSRAPGFRKDNVYVMAGIPRVMQAMFDGVKLTLKGGPPVLSRTVGCNLPEGTVAQGLGAIQDRYRDLDIGSYPAFRRGGGFWVSLVLRGRNPSRLEAAAGEVAAMVRDLGGHPTLE